jgi:hypothetical protein
VHGNGERQEVERVVHVQPADMTLSRLLARPRTAERDDGQPKADRAAEIIRQHLADGEWHPAASIRDVLYEQGLNSNSVVTDAKRRAVVESRQSPGAVHGGWEWRIAATPFATSRARSEPLTVPGPPSGLNPQRPPSDSQIPGVVTTVSEDGTTKKSRRVVLCCCHDGGIDGEEGHCGRCYGMRS